MSSASVGTLSSDCASVPVRDLRGHERVTERTVELRADLDDPDPRAGPDADGMAQPVVRTRRVRAHDLLVRQHGALDARPGREAAVGRHRLALDHPRALFVQEARMGDVPHPRDAIPAAQILIQTRPADLARAALGLGPAVDEFVARPRLPLADERDLDHDGGLGPTYGGARLKGLRPRRFPPPLDSRIDTFKSAATIAGAVSRPGGFPRWCLPPFFETRPEPPELAALPR